MTRPPPPRTDVLIENLTRTAHTRASVAQEPTISPLPSRFHSVYLIGVPMDLGANRRGVDMGPSALRIAGLQPSIEALGITVEDRGNI
ncbi:MAG: arginase family protein, partial [Chloroflexi bacterium]|nr:arginase family protein [Chloroflexota bacterium]